MPKTPTVPSAELVDFQQWLEQSDEENAWDRILGRRLKGAREARMRGASATTPSRRRSGTSGSRAVEGAFTQESLAPRLHRTQGWLSKIENGERTVSVYCVYLIAEALGADPLELLQPLTKAERTSIAAEKRALMAERAAAGITAEQLWRHSQDGKRKRRATTLSRRRGPGRIE